MHPIRLIPALSLALVFAVVGGSTAGCSPPRQVVDVTADDPISGQPAEDSTEEPVQPETATVESDSTRPPLRETPSARTPETQKVDRADLPPFHSGRMWTFHNPPIDYLDETYGFRPDTTWLNRARRGAVRFSTYCSASFVSPNGLLVTNHHCARQSIADVTGVDEGLLDDGYLAESAGLERRVPDLYVEQLVGMENVSEAVHSAADNVRGAGPKAEARTKRADAIERARNSRLAERDSTMRAEVVELYSGVEYWVYTYRRYTDVRLVMAPELEMGYFGGDPDNFTYPRYTLDFAFFRVYENDQPLAQPDYFTWDTDGAREGDLVFTVGNPGSTTRLNTPEMLRYLRDNDLPNSLDVLRARRDILAEYVRTHSADVDSFDLRNDLMSLENTIKAQTGQLDGLVSGGIIDTRSDVLSYVSQQIESSDSLRSLYGSVINDIALIQRSKKASAAKAQAFTHFLNPSASSHILTRGMYGYVYTLLRQRGAPADQLEEIRKEASRIPNWPADLERRLIEERLEDLREWLGDDDPTMKRLLAGGTPETLADSIVTYTALLDSTGFLDLMDGNYLSSKDVSVPVVNAIAPLYFTLDQQLGEFVRRESQLLGRLARAQFHVFGDDLAPDATFTLRLSDGVVTGYPFNGTRAPAFTTFYGIYDHAFSYPDSTGQGAWALPERWTTPPEGFDLSTPLNLVSTNDITGGNSGSPLLDRDLEFVGIAFDGNIESLPNEFLYSDDRARTISVDARAIHAVLGTVYGASRLVEELESGTFVAGDTAGASSSGE